MKKKKNSSRNKRETLYKLVHKFHVLIIPLWYSEMNNGSRGMNSHDVLSDI